MKTSLYLERILGLPLNRMTAARVDREAAIIDFAQGKTILMEGDSSSSLYLVVKGLVRGYYIDAKGNDITKCFSGEHEFCGTEGFRTSLPATFSIECLEDSRCIQISYALLREFLETDSAFADWVNRLFQIEISKQEARSRDFVLLSAEERYQAFCCQQPQLSRRAALKHVASYIGVRPASLSRIRKETGTELT